MSISSTIDEIIQKRQNDIKPKYKKLWEKAIPYINLASSLKEWVYYDNDDNYNANFQALLKSNQRFETIFSENVQEVKNFIEKVERNIGIKLAKEGGGFEYLPQGCFDAVDSRVNKSEIEVCVMGPVSSGKSVFMQGLTGAPKTVLPTGSGKTTATRTTFRNASKEEVKAIVVYYTKEEFKNNVFNDFIKNLNIAIDDYNKDKHKKVSHFPEWNGKESLATFCENLRNSDSFKDEFFLKKQITGIDTLIRAVEYFITFKELYIERVSDYASFLDHSADTLDLQQINDGELVPYVSYKQKPDDDKVTSCLALAVKEVIIDWPLQTSNNEDLGKLSLVDTMGIGEAKFSVEENLLEIVRQRADLAIALCRIKDKEDNFDVNHEQDKKFLGVLSKLQDRKPQSWVYYLANVQANGEIQEDTISDIKNALWDYMVQGCDGFSLNKHYWSFLEFCKKDELGNNTPNSDAIVQYFVSFVLANLKKDIEKIDDDFISQAEKDFNEVKQYIDRLKLLFTKLIGVGIDIVDEDTLLDTSVDSVIKDITNELVELSATISQENDIHCKKIMDKVYPLLCEPELFRKLNINIDEKENLFIKFEAPNPELKKYEDTDKRELLVFHILSQLNFYRVHPGFQGKSFDEAKDYVLKQFENNSNWKSEIKSIREFINQSFFEKVYRLTEDRIKTIVLNRINPQIDMFDEQKQEIYKNEVGRELQYFYKMREEILFGILGRVNTDDKKNADAELTKYFTEQTKSVVERVCRVIREQLQNGGIDLNQQENQDDIQWIKDFASKSKGKSLMAAVEEFVGISIRLNAIVTKKQADELLENLCMVDLKYRNRKEAAYSTFASLFIIDRQLRYTLWRMYVKTFENFGIYKTHLDGFYNKVFAIYQNDNTNALQEFRSVIKRMKKQKFEDSDEGKLVKAKESFDLCYDVLNQIR